MRKYILYNPHWKDYRRVEKTLDEKPATWERYEHEEGGKEKILDMEIKEYKQAKERQEEGKLGRKEAYKAAKHVAAAAIQLMCSIRGENDDKV